MKKRIIIILFLFMTMAVLPMLSVRGWDSLLSPDAESSEPERSAPRDSAGNDSEDSFIILDTSTGNTVKLSGKEFLRGALSYEMAPSFETEALKAQAVACYTYFSRLREHQRENPDPEMKGADIKADLSIGQFYLSDSQLREKWGSSYEKGISKIKSVCDSVYGMTITDSGGELIDAAYHANSGGCTEDAGEVFGIENKNLRSVASPGDAYAPDYITDTAFTADEFRERLHNSGSEIKFSGSPEDYIKSCDCTPAGTVTKINICGTSLTGQQIRKAFDLNSAVFAIEYSDGIFTFTVRGCGHGVGMSQYGANSMALSGAGFEEILLHYYSDAEIRSQEFI